MRSAADIAAFIASQPAMLAVLRIAAALRLPDCWVGAGFVRKAVWDALSNRPYELRHSDIDIVYFDPVDVRPERDWALDAQLRAAHPGQQWEVRNQARMHTKHDDPPYRNSSQAIAHWTETCTAVAARLHGDSVEILAPHGVEDLLNFIVRPTPRSDQRPDDYRARMAGKTWGTTWPQLTILGL